MKRLLALVLLAAAASCGDALPTETAVQPPSAPSLDYQSTDSCNGVICGPVWIYIDGPQMYDFYWTATPTSGTPPYSYSWKIHYDLWGSGAVGTNSPSLTFGVNGTDYHFDLELTVKDAYNTTVHHDWHRVLVCDTPTYFC
jgi:hypothetical protein